MTNRNDRFAQLQQVAPMLQVSDMQQSLDYYQAVLGFSIDRVWPNEEDPRWVHLSRDDIQVILTIDLGTSSRPFIAEKGNGVVFYVTTDHVDALYQELEESGAIIVQDPITFGQRKQFSIADVNGYVFVFCESL